MPEAYLDPGQPAHARMCAAIARELNLTSLVYQRLDDMIAAIGLPRERVCTFCWDRKG